MLPHVLWKTGLNGAARQDATEGKQKGPPILAAMSCAQPSMTTPTMAATSAAMVGAFASATSDKIALADDRKATQ